MPSAQAKKRAEAKKKAEKERMAKKTGKKEEEKVEEKPEVAVEEVTEDLAKLNQRGTSGVLSSHPLSADIHIHNFSMTFHGRVGAFEC